MAGFSIAVPEAHPIFFFRGRPFILLTLRVTRGRRARTTARCEPAACRRVHAVVRHRYSPTVHSAHCSVGMSILAHKARLPRSDNMTGCVRQSNEPISSRTKKITSAADL
jgi:hypothetical protein